MWITSMGNHVAVGGFSECRHSSCSSCHQISKWYDKSVLCYRWVKICNFAMNKQGPSHYFHLHARVPPTAVPGCVDERIKCLEILVNTDSGNGFLHDGTKPLPETMWAYHQIFLFCDTPGTTLKMSLKIAKMSFKSAWIFFLETCTQQSACNTLELHLFYIESLILCNRLVTVWLHVTGLSHQMACIMEELSTQKLIEILLCKVKSTLDLQMMSWQCQGPGACLNIKTVFPGIEIPIIKIRKTWDCVTFIMGICILVRQHLHFETVPRSSADMILIIAILIYWWLYAKDIWLQCVSNGD